VVSSFGIIRITTVPSEIFSSSRIPTKFPAAKPAPSDDHPLVKKLFTDFGAERV
jgi:hypothetical protein